MMFRAILSMSIICSPAYAISVQYIANDREQLAALRSAIGEMRNLRAKKRLRNFMDLDGYQDSYLDMVSMFKRSNNRLRNFCRFHNVRNYAKYCKTD